MTKSEAIKKAIWEAKGDMDTPRVREVCKRCVAGLDNYGVVRIMRKTMELKAEYDRTEGRPVLKN